MKDIPWHDHTEEFVVCKARVRYIHLRPAAVNGGSSAAPLKRPIVFLHGSQSWSYTWRKVCSIIYSVCSPVPDEQR
jgi:pimeloyl-ACP methyl ester carboxylesterase